MTGLPYELDPSVDRRTRFGLIVLQEDETIEGEIYGPLAATPADVHVSRVDSGIEVTTDTLAQMKAALPRAAGLLPGGRNYDVIGYGCTSGTSVIGANAVADLIRQGAAAKAVTDPLTATVAWCRAQGITRLSVLSPYVESVNARLLSAFERAGIEVAAFGSFNVAAEATVVRISAASIIAAATALHARAPTDGLFLSCTNLRTVGVLPAVAAQTGTKVTASNSALCWHMKHLAADAGKTTG